MEIPNDPNDVYNFWLAVQTQSTASWLVETEKSLDGNFTH